jgi:hypothetical protein
MTIGPENFSNGASKSDDRFAPQLGPYRPGGRRDAGRAIAEAANDMPTRNGGSALDARGSAVDTRGNAHDGRGNVIDARSAALDAAAPIGSSIAAPKLSDAAMRNLNELTEPVFSPEPWLDQPASSLVDHPLLRGLLMELPPKGTLPAPEYLDRWFEAARSILDLLYTMNARP